MQLDLEKIDKIIKNALDEDIGEGDITSFLTIGDDEKTSMAFVSRENIVVCGLDIIARLFEIFDSKIEFSPLKKDGEIAKNGEKIATVSGSAKSILTTERTALNLLQHLCGIATKTHEYVEAIKGTNAKILDTRKTTPCLRVLEKYAVRTGGGQNHRMRLDDGILIKDNHIHIAGGIKEALIKAKEGNNKGLKIEIECDTLEQLSQAIEAGADIILLDNMSAEDLKEAVSISGGKVKLEASGGITLENINEIAKTGVDFISVGAITHSARNVDIGLDAA